MSNIVNAITKNTQDLERLEGVIQKNLGSFYEMGRALMEIRDGELYNKVRGIENFETYCKQRWDFKRTYAFYMIEAVRVTDNVHNCEQKPMSESQCRPLINLEPDEQRKVWQMAVETAPDNKVTAAHVAKVVREMTEAPRTFPPVPPHFHAGQVSGHRVSCLDLRNSLISRDEMKIGGQVVDKN